MFLVSKANQEPKMTLNLDLNHFIRWLAFCSAKKLKRLTNVFLIIKATREPKMTLNLDLNHLTRRLTPCSAETY